MIPPLCRLSIFFGGAELCSPAPNCSVARIGKGFSQDACFSPTMNENWTSECMVEATILSSDVSMRGPVCPAPPGRRSRLVNPNGGWLTHVGGILKKHLLSPKPQNPNTPTPQPVNKARGARLPFRWLPWSRRGRLFPVRDMAQDVGSVLRELYQGN